MTATLILIAIAGALVWVGIYAAQCWWRPLTYCWCCPRGSGRHHNKKGTTFRRCWVCKGTGHRWRIGRRIYVFFRKRVHT